MNTVEEKRAAREELLQLTEAIEREFRKFERAEGRIATDDVEALESFVRGAGEHIGCVLAYLRAEGEGAPLAARAPTATSKALFGYVMQLARESLSSAETSTGPSRLHWLVQARVHVTEAIVFAERYAT